MNKENVTFASDTNSLRRIRNTDTGADNLKISVRVRPVTANEVSRRNVKIIEVIDKNMLMLREEVPSKLDALRAKRKKDVSFAYDNVFSEDSSQNDVYSSTTKPIIPDVLQGYNATVFAYGPTGTGKTFTMVGTPRQPGIMINALNDLFKEMKKGPDTFTVYMSYLEIYNEVIRDLLVKKSKALELREDAKTGVIQVAGLTEISTTSTDEVMKLLENGNKKRSCESTAANATSSRSHALLQINVRLSHHSSTSNSEKVKMGRLFMVDLAGSERAKKTQNVGKRLQEGAHINKSLLALGNVINALAEGGAKFVNFRDSKLTRLLKDALTGNCKTVMIAHVSPVDIHREETRNTLIYADRAKQISTKTRQNKLDVSYHVSQYQTIIGELKLEIRRLKDKLGDNIDSPSNSAHNVSHEEIELLKLKLVENFNEQMELRKRLMEIDNSMVGLSMDFQKQNDVISEWEAEKARLRAKKRGSDSGNTSGVESDRDDYSDDDEPEEIMEAWEDLIYLQDEEKRYAEMKLNVEKELEDMRHKSKKMEELVGLRKIVQNSLNENCQQEMKLKESLPSRMTSNDQKELLALLCKVHELEIHQVEMESNAILKEHELYQRDLLLLRYDRQRSLCDEIITKQRTMLEEGKKAMPLELEELYALYQMELQYTNNEKEARSSSDWNIRSGSVLSNRSERLPPIGRESEKLFKPGRRHSFTENKRPSTPLSLRSPTCSAPCTAMDSRIPSLPPITGAHNSDDSGLKLFSRPIKTRRKIVSRHPPLQKPISVEDILFVDSPKTSHKDLKDKRKPLPKFNRRESLPALDLAYNRSRLNSGSSSESDQTLRRGRERLPSDKDNFRRGNSLTRNYKKLKQDKKSPTPVAVNNRLSIPLSRKLRSRSDEALTNVTTSLRR